MITEDYVSFEVANLLKGKGFDEPCFAYYNLFYDNEGKEMKLWRKFPHRMQPNSDYLNVPTHQMAMKWLREIYSLEIYPYHDFPKVGDKWWFEIIKYPNSVSEYESESIYNSYEETIETAIKYCLENLI